ncbi:hypothetical protein IEQ34_002355 [Dendrobium chrysotoxum]|uniref:Uncharacterized protein n=1 Tax=Dendrobium chrysotoxum TaxID=161865 RepID=A0AAV7HM15_DENCH|nr:hypothetical protein IEQ34_002355 [Dendrobium chrysotoxum]
MQLHSGGCSFRPDAIFTVGHLNHGAVMNVFIRNETAPEPVRLPDEYHLLNGNPLCLRKKDGNKDSHDQYPTSEKVEQPKLKPTKKRQKRLRNNEGKKHVHRNRNTLPCRSYLQRKNLRRHQPTQRPPGPREPSHVDADESHHPRRVALGQVTFAGSPKLGGDEGADNYLASEHLYAALQEKLTAAEAIDGEDRDECGKHVDEAGDDGGHEGGVAAETDSFE